MNPWITTPGNGAMPPPADLAPPCSALPINMFNHYHSFSDGHIAASTPSVKSRIGPSIRGVQMDKAIEICNGAERLVSAVEVQQKYHGANPFNVRYICPLCRQPLNTASMRSSKNVPHFRHERNNVFAQQCENYVNAYGYPSTYQRAPLPMYIRQARESRDSYIIEVGFRHIKPNLLKTLQNDEAVLRIGNKRYEITERRFGSGITRLPLESPMLACSAHISIEHSRFNLREVWGMPIDATTALVFSHDEETHQGRRLNPGDTAQPGNRLYILVPDIGTQDVHRSFPHAKIVGHTNIALPGPCLHVCDVEIPQNENERSAASAYLASCGIETTEDERAATLIWPPSIMSDGNEMPLFSKSKCLFSVPRSASKDRKLYIHTSLDSHDCIRTEALKPTANPSYLYCATSLTSDLCVVSTGNWSSNSILLLHPAHMLGPFTQTSPEDEVFVTEKDDGTVLVDSSVKCTIAVFQSGMPTKSLELVRDASQWHSENPLDAALRIQVKLENSSAMRTLVDIVPNNPIKMNKGNQAPDPSEVKARLLRTTDQLRACSRAIGVRLAPNATIGQTIALMRKELR